MFNMFRELKVKQRGYGTTMENLKTLYTKTLKTIHKATIKTKTLILSLTVKRRVKMRGPVAQLG